MKDIKNTTQAERNARVKELKRQRRSIVSEYIKIKNQLREIDMEMNQIENANNGHFFEMTL
jgi:uncharacterized protein YPO0396